MNITSIGKFVAVSALVVSTALVFAQGGGGAGGGRGGGQGRGGFGQRGGFGAGPLQLAMRPDVQRDLAVTDDQKTKIAALQTKQREEMVALRPAGGGGGGGGNGGGGGGRGGFQMTPEQREAMEKINAKYKAELGTIL